MRTSLKYSELLTTQNRKMLESWQIQGQASFVFDENCKGYLLNLNSASIECPKNAKHSLKLLRPFIMFQVYFYPGKLFTLELIASDSDGVKRRIILTHCKSITRNLMHTRLPNACIEKNTWLYLYLNVVSLFNLCFPTRAFRSLDGITLSATCKLRKIYSISEMDIDYLLPSGSELPKYLKIKTQCVTSKDFECLSSSLTDPLASPAIKHKLTSMSLPKIQVNLKKNIFAINSLGFNSARNEVVDTKKELIQRASFRNKKIVKHEIDDNEARLREQLRKITHIHYQENPDEVIEESIVIEQNEGDSEFSLIEALQSQGDSMKKVYNTPNYYNSSIKTVLQLRHITPPFANVHGSFTYNPIERAFETEITNNT
ncbi:hypothetical protein SteCoe_16144 [Stentor coeruleus]|uniref:CFA20 domain-containing protein n=1 Tax=Stentor coeruleus TaxID=5963 RepID=A0A1R2C235_9CILI|nr:hypothetical protein SteCoe_16144 [Stentor coeruleus]